MTIIFYGEDDNLHIASSGQKMISVSKNDRTILNKIPNNDVIYYVENAHKVTKKQFAEWIGIKNTVENNRPKFYLTPTGNGNIHLADLKTDNFPNGLELKGKWDFIDIDEIGEDNLYKSVNFKIASKKGQIKIVPESYYNQNKHRKTTNISPAQAALDKILVPPDIKVDQYLENIGNDTDAIEIEVE